MNREIKNKVISFSKLRSRKIETKTVPCIDLLKQKLVLDLHSVRKDILKQVQFHRNDISEEAMNIYAEELLNITFEFSNIIMQTSYTVSDSLTLYSKFQSWLETSCHRMLSSS